MIDTEIQRVIDESPCEVRRYGEECEYIPWTGNLAFKLFSTKRIRDEAYDLQSLAADMNIAPCVAGKFESFDKYGYITEVVPHVASDYLKDEIREARYEDNGEGRDWKERAKREEKIRNNCGLPEVEKLLNSIGLDTSDNHFNNWGFDKHLNVVWLDFGNEVIRFRYEDGEWSDEN